MHSRYLFLHLLIASAYVCIGTAPVLASKDSWKPVDPAEISLKSPTVEKDADAEGIFWEVHVEDQGDKALLSHYIRIKIFNERGRDNLSKVDLSYTTKNKIEDIAGRTIKPDGTIVELDSSTIFERTLVQAKGVKVQAKSFAMPAVEPGAIIEYRWRERRHHLLYFLRLPLQRDIPLQRVRYFIKPDSNLLSSMRAQTFNAPSIPLTKEKDGYYSATMTNVPAFREEPQMPPEDQVRPWMLIYYLYSYFGPEGFWAEFSKAVYEQNKSRMKADTEVRKEAQSTIAGASTAEQKLQRLFEFCRSKIKNVNDDASRVSPEDRDRFKENKSPADTLKRGVGTGSDINLLFAALASAAGLEARVALLGDRSDIFFDHRIHHPYFLETSGIAVRVDNQWRFFDPAHLHVPYGMLRWQEEGLEALVSDPNQTIFVHTALSPAEKSLLKRTAKLRLSEDGTLEGDVQVEYGGHEAIENKEFYDGKSPEQCEELLRDLVKQRMTTAEISNIVFTDLTESTKPLRHSYHVRVPGYAQRTGKRLFLQPAYFQKGRNSLFPTSERKYDVYFHYPWTENDDVTIDLPPGFALDNADSPSPIKAGTDCNYAVKMSVTVDGRTLYYRRSFSFGGSGFILVPAREYAHLKQVFDALHEKDNHTITLKQTAIASK